MKKLVLGIFILAGITAYAQDGHHKKHDRKDRFSMVKEELNLTDDQVTKIKGLHEEFKPQIKAIWKNEDISSDEKKEKTAALRKEKREKMANFLSAEQLSQMDKMRNHREKKFRKIKDKLNITEEQKAQMQEIRKKYVPEIKSIKESNLSESKEKKSLKVVRKKMKKEMNEVLTDEQKKMMKEQKKKWKHKKKKK